ncbi:MAG TPA: NAD(P)/FAD-dependent oxidoreductase [Paracoccaceae bacterium]|uniref:NAD(P)/FAD-dependent oxidoreductase n=1 Tax=Hydrogenophaga sp. TaxID=1904254 RepID=UPI002BE0ED95|nr:NAD(P)/FAD-dependent oxidoreductase [Hydrogenophaga sp.]HMO06068.1 NAD(P)/FAD-dependent oxidoreductase [Paracoccaceae bacterium]HMP11223.1 NAD(P)/FAD-dependent oxidoreductase [Hydrogenophaga sp.]
MEQVDVVVVGAGVVGLAVSRALALAGREVLVLECEAQIGSGTSARNSEVIHAGIYYPAGSLKARLCVQGRQLLYDYLQERQIGHRRCGKLIVATTPGQLAGLPAVVERARANGVDDLRQIDREEALSLEPALTCLGAVLSPSTGILDSHALMLSLQGDLEHAGGTVVCHSGVQRLSACTAGIGVSTADGTELMARAVVNAAGLHACALGAATEGLDPRFVPQARYAKGSYFTLAGRAPFSRLIYPAPEPDAHLAGLGVHLTLDLGGQARFGPDVQWVDGPEHLEVDAARATLFEAEVRRYWPGLQDGLLQPGYAGIRPKISGPGEPAADFCIQGPAQHGVPGLVNLFGIESPGLTSCLAIGEYVAGLLSERP